MFNKKKPQKAIVSKEVKKEEMKKDAAKGDINVDLENKIKQCIEMGFSRELSITALNAAYYDVERAIQYLTDGMPIEYVHNIQANQQFAQNELQEPEDYEGHHYNQLTPEVQQLLAQYTNSPAFQQIRERLVQDPNYLEELITQLESSNPTLANAISENPEAFLEFIMGGENEDSNEDQGEPAIQLSAEDRAAIDRLRNLGFSEMQVAQAYFACEKNEELTANYLFENAESLRKELEEVPENFAEQKVEQKKEQKKEEKKEQKKDQKKDPKKII